MTTADGDTRSDKQTTIQVLYFGLVRNVVKEAEEIVTLPAGATVRDLLNILCQKHGEPLRDALFTVEGTLIANALILLDGSNVLYRQGLDTEIDSQRSLHVLLTTTAMAGG
jgi:molybdopterin converting factor small subunit